MKQKQTDLINYWQWKARCKVATQDEYKTQGFATESQTFLDAGLKQV
ncbi:hypothetical protein [Psychrosphaera algicola]|uniref:Uncharacterized protein n=1 Tax=Psychrosphaera algicola TaxID=3023714 RepID=A0ABT5FF51_9GAMM|nr:hypothetical protein [Psychrosphaera sp. G1-22]MDC2889674.1 hypothetical protein [Psychrosphaera sp. G1-22]